MVQFSKLCLAAVVLAGENVGSFAFSANQPPGSSETSLARNIRLKKEEETRLREEIQQKNEIVEDENVLKAYAIADGDNMDMEEEEIVSPVAVVDGSSLEREVARAIKTRAYPLFLAEKAAYVVDDLVSFVDDFSSKSSVQVGNGGNTSSKVNGTKERVVVLGTGWGAAAFLKEIDTEMFDVTVISPRNFFLFTPMLAGASVGTVEYRSITESVREINSKVNYLEATATEIDPKSRKVMCESVVCEGNSCEIDDFEIEYDRLIVGVGAQTNTFGIAGVRDHCCFLKQVGDARRIRTSIVNCFERANIPGMSEERKQQTLTFAVIGAGPTGIEFASELRDFIEQDGPKYYPNLLRYVRIKVIEASNTVLAPFDKSLQQAAIEQLQRPSSARTDPRVAELLPEDFKLTELLLESGVKEVKEDEICLNNGETIPYGLSVWAAGNGPLPITLQLIEALGEGEQAEAQSQARGRLAIDPWCRVLGSDGSILSFGDCATNPQNMLPATAQVASQQGVYLARLFEKGDFGSKGEDGKLLPVMRKQGDGVEESLADKITAFAIQSDRIAAPFQFLNLGILAYTGSGTALSQLQITPQESARVKGKGKIGFGLWRSVYLSKQVSFRNRALVLTDWIKTQIFGRDITRLE
mmetsp:Transcript_11414/g.17163  ORF Transcript_11414/g.17163 Transcript_11414/m.17163 type:complete len:640 (-) Transcript_11414:60-1979(-)